jgi:phenylacetate-CoA ligase
MNRGTFKNSTGGSTGVPTIIFQDNIYQARTLAATNLFFDWAGRSLGGSYVKLWGAARDFTRGGGGFIYWLGNFAGNRLILNTFSLSLESMKDYLKKIEQFRPLVIEGYVDSLAELARFILGEKITIKHRPNGIISSAGTLFAEVRSRIEEAFRAPVFNRYGSREAGNIACECSYHTGLHVMEETTYLEIVDESCQPLQPGMEGEVLITNLWNYTMPLIRYRIGDRAIWSEQTCLCGRPYGLLEAVTGRSSANFKRADGGVVSPSFFIHFLGVIHNEGGIKKFQIIQEAYDRIVVFIVPEASFKIDTWPGKNILTQQIHKAMGNACKVEYTLVNEIQKTPTGKHEYTICKI